MRKQNQKVQKILKTLKFSRSWNSTYRTGLLTHRVWWDILAEEQWEKQLLEVLISSFLTWCLARCRVFVCGSALIRGCPTHLINQRTRTYRVLLLPINNWILWQLSESSHPLYCDILQRSSWPLSLNPCWLSGLIHTQSIQHFKSHCLICNKLPQYSLAAPPPSVGETILHFLIITFMMAFKKQSSQQSN